MITVTLLWHINRLSVSLSLVAAKGVVRGGLVDRKDEALGDIDVRGPRGSKDDVFSHVVGRERGETVVFLYVRVAVCRSQTVLVVSLSLPHTHRISLALVATVARNGEGCLNHAGLHRWCMSGLSLYPQRTKLT